VIATETNVDAYRIGWWTHAWWPTRALLVGLLTGKQPSPRADNGSRYVGRRAFVAPIIRRLRKLGRPHRPWQAEPESLAWHVFCRRALTARGAERKMRADVAHYQEYGEPSRWQRRCWSRYADVLQECADALDACDCERECLCPRLGR